MEIMNHNKFKSIIAFLFPAIVIFGNYSFGEIRLFGLVLTIGRVCIPLICLYLLADNYRNKEKINESFKRMKELYSYKSSDNEQNSGKYENEIVGKMISESKEKLFTKTEDPKDRFFKTLVGGQE